MNKWITHLKDYAKKEGIAYRDAMKCPKCKEAYHKLKTVIKKELD
jgi:phage FluMu protein Com